jgi:hypothetical protein
MTFNRSRNDVMVRAFSFLFGALAELSLFAAPLYAKSTERPFSSPAADRRAIEVLLSNYTKAVSTKNQALFETLLLSKDIPFSYVSNGDLAVDEHGTRQYQAFRKSVFEGPAFTQSFKDVHIHQDGNLADVTLVFVNVDAKGPSSGWKTMQLLKVKGSWKIASEFFTGG